MKFAYIKAEDGTIHKMVEFDDSATWAEVITGVIRNLNGNNSDA